MKLVYRLIALVVFMQFVSCSGSDDNASEVEEPNVEVELVYYNYELNIDENTFVWEYEVNFKNTSKTDAHGYAQIYHRQGTDDSYIETYTNDGKSRCNIIKGGETCVYTFYLSDSYDPALISPDFDQYFSKGVYIFDAE
ncbi:hypothetical protein [Joostella sp. CR20]|uniref:hypothetical protein n=1 Tax=Joostella sp. CR20 TaxID=2804312 RepID=UPI00313E9242